jgi:hypothetical protein
LPAARMTIWRGWCMGGLSGNDFVEMMVFR